MPVVDPARVIENRVAAIANLHTELGVDRAQLDVSGGVDSAVMLGLLARALGAAKITAVYSAIHSDKEAGRRAEAAAEVFGIRLIRVELTPVFETLLDTMLASMADAGHDLGAVRGRMEADPTVLGSIRSCLRAPIGRGYNRLSGGGIRHGTGNECEDRFLRFYQKGGDGEVDTNPIAMLAKGEVYQIARALGVPRVILETVPSPDLQATGSRHTDEAELLEMAGVPWTYSRINTDTGAYRSVGTIERMARLLDLPLGQGTVETALFADASPREDPELWDALLQRARPLFAEYAPEEIDAFLVSARRMERVTRHKMNPNIPTLGTREALRGQGLITDALPLDAVSTDG